MSFYHPNAIGKADGEWFANTMTGIDAALDATLGRGVITGLTVNGAGQVQPGKALIGHLVTVTEATSVTASLVASATNFLFLCCSPTAKVQANGEDAGTLIVNQTGTAPTSSVLLASVVTGAGSPPSITSVNNTPAGRTQLYLPVAASLVSWAGPYDAAVAYAVGKIASYQGSSYICVAATTGNAPATGGAVDAHWNLVAAKGDKGDAATVAVHTVTTGAAGSAAGVTNVGDTHAASLDFTIPRGDTGATGATGDAATVAVHGTSTVAPGTAAAVTNVGDTHAASLDFAVPRGSVWLTGAGAPGSGLGGETDLYLNTTNGDLYRRESGAWAPKTNLTGPAASTTRTVQALGTPTLVFPDRDANYRVTCDFSSVGHFADADFTARLRFPGIPGANIGQETNHQAVGKASWTVYIPADAPLTGYVVSDSPEAAVAGYGWTNVGSGENWTVTQF